MPIVGRDHERARLRELLARAAEGHGGLVVLEGVPGIGKSELLDAVLPPSGATEGDDGPRVLRITVPDSEAELAFAGLHALLWPVIDRVPGLPNPQARALGGALGLGPSGADRFLVAAATLTLLTDLAAERPLVVVVDDAQWLDQPSMQCLAFVARRITHDPVTMLLATDEPDEELRDLPVLTLEGLVPDVAETLLRERRPDLSGSERARVLALAEGNPLGLLELPVPPSDADDAEPVPVNDAIRSAFRGRLTQPTSDAQTLLLLVAAHSGAPVDLIRAAASAAGVAESAWSEALSTDVLIVDNGRVRFSHRLCQSTAYDAASPEDRRRAHRALTEVLDPVADQERRVWHLAAAVPGHDEDAALLLESIAATTLRRGPRSAAKAFRRAATLSPDPQAGAARLARAARAEWEGGRAEEARTLLEQAGRELGPRAVAQASGGLLGLMEFVQGDSGVASALLLRDAAALAEGVDGAEGADRNDADRDGFETLVALGVRAAWSAGRVDPAEPVNHRDLGLHLEGPAREYADRVFEAWRTGGPPLERAWGGADPWLLPSAQMAVARGQQVSVYSAYRAAADLSRERGASTALATTLSQMATISIDAGRFDQAHAEVAEAMAIAEVTNQTNVVAQCTNSLAWMAALCGNRQATERLAARSIALAQARGVRAVTAFAQWHRGTAALLGGAPNEAAELLVPISDPRAETHHPTVAVLAAADAGEAAARVGALDVLEDQIGVLDRWHVATGVVWARSAGEVLRALASPGTEAEPLFLSALDGAVGMDRPLWTARVNLLYGEWLRRARRREDASRRLAPAADTFRRLGAATLLARTEQDLQLAAGPQRSADVPYSDELTNQEERVARLAAVGLTNRSIAAQLFISPRTVGHHLSAVYRKLSVDSRTQLARALPEDGAVASAS